MKALFKRKPDTVYTIMDFQDGELVEYYGECDRRTAQSRYVLFQGSTGIRLIGRDELQDPCERCVHDGQEDMGDRGECSFCCDYDYYVAKEDYEQA